MSCCPRKCRRFTVLGLAFVLAGSLGAYVFLKSRDAQARPPLGRSWPADLRVSVDRIDHSRFDTLLKTYVDGDGYVDYQAWKASAGDRRELQRYLADLGRADLKRRATRSARLAFWINAYNAVTIEGILQVYPTDSIRNHTSPLIGYNIWKHLPLRVADQTVSLNDIEHKILRKMREPRIHFAVVCASVGCPKLRNEAFTAEERRANWPTTRSISSPGRSTCASTSAIARSTSATS
ncbi:MAG: DUF547 domain-containing protein [Planctomycetaceae bacterium]